MHINVNIARYNAVSSPFLLSRSNWDLDLLKRQLAWNAAHKTKNIIHTLDTKYYTADIEFWLHNEDLLEKELNSIGELTDALILTFNSKQVCSSDQK